MAGGSITNRIAESYLREMLEDHLDLSVVSDPSEGQDLVDGVVKLLLEQGAPQYRPRAGQIVLSFMVEEPKPKRAAKSTSTPAPQG